MKKLPVFFHVPKCAGTYVADWLLIGFRNYRRTNTKWLLSHVPEKDSIKTIQILKEGLIVAKIFVGDPNYILDESYTAIKLTKNDFSIELNKENVINCLKNVFVFAVIIESHGFKLSDQILSYFENYDLCRFVILRDPFNRARSIFYYNQSEASKHDYNNKAFGNMNFENYILSNYVSDSWLIRNLLQIKSNEIITQHHFDKTLALLKNQFTVYDIKQADKAIADILLKCYQIDPKNIQLRNWDFITKNENVYRKIQLEELPLNIQEAFKQRTYWDQKLYNYFCKK